MPTFAYRAVDAAGRRTTGEVTGATAAAVTRELEVRGLYPLEVTEEARAPAGGGFLTGRRRAVLEYTRAVAALLPAGMPLARALATAETTAPAGTTAVFTEVRRKVERGESLAVAMAEHPGYFSSLYVGIVRAGEKSGSLDGAFGRLTSHLEREDALRSRLLSLSIYPILLTIVGFVSVVVLVVFVLPRFADLLLTSGASLPRATATVLAISTGARENWRLLLAIPLLLAILVAWTRTTVGGQDFAARAIVRIPGIGRLRRQRLAASFARMVGELVAGGAPLLTALADARDCLADPVARGETDRIRTRVREGGALNAAIAQSPLFPPVLAQLVGLGEEAGRLSEFLLRAADILERRTERTLERMVALAEPLMIVFFGGLVALVALALLQAIYGVNVGSFQ